MKKSFAFFLLFLVATGHINTFSQKMGDAYRLFINNINLPLNRIGDLAKVNIYHPDPIINGAGGKIDGKVFLFAGGFFFSGSENGVIWSNAVAASSLLQDYVPGINGFVTDPRAQLYRVRKSDTAFSSSWNDWIDAVNLGADFYDGNNDGIYIPADLNGNGQWDTNEDSPDILGDETLWCVFHDGLPSSQRRWTNVPPKGIEIRQTIFAYSSPNSIRNTIFIRYKIVNTGAVTNLMDSVYFGIWDDADLGDALDDLTGCDVNSMNHFTYNDSSDSEFGNNPPSFMVKFLSRPHSYIPDVTFIDMNSNGEYDEGVDTPLDTARYNHGQLLGVKQFPGAKNINPFAMMSYYNSDPILGDPFDERQARNYLFGLSRIGESIDPCTWPYGGVYGGVNCSTINKKFWYSGDPILEYGWIQIFKGDVRQVSSIGPFKLKVGKAVEILVAYIAGRGSSALNSISVTRNFSQVAANFYNSNFDLNSIVGISEFEELLQPIEFHLFQNYPNPFNPSTTIEFALPVTAQIKVKVYDILGRVVNVIYDGVKNAGYHQMNWNSDDASGNSVSSGVYFYELNAVGVDGWGFNQMKKMILIK